MYVYMCVCIDIHLSQSYDTVTVETFLFLPQQTVRHHKHPLPPIQGIRSIINHKLCCLVVMSQHLYWFASDLLSWLSFAKFGFFCTCSVQKWISTYWDPEHVCLWMLIVCQTCSNQVFQCEAGPAEAETFQNRNLRQSHLFFKTKILNILTLW